MGRLALTQFLGLGEPLVRQACAVAGGDFLGCPGATPLADGDNPSLERVDELDGRLPCGRIVQLREVSGSGRWREPTIADRGVNDLIVGSRHPLLLVPSS